MQKIVIRSGKRRYHEPRRNTLLRRMVQVGLPVKNELQWTWMKVVLCDMGF